MQTMGTFVANHAVIMQSLPVSPSAWYPVAIVAILALILIAAIVYMLSGIINSENAKQWSRFQIYEALLSVLLLSVFVAVTYIFFLNPQPVFGALKIVPQPQNGLSGCTGATQIFTLATCDVSQFNNASFSMFRYAFLSTYITNFISGYTVVPKFDPIEVTPTINIEFQIPSIIPEGTENLLEIVDDAILFSLIFNQLQLIVLSGAVFFLAFFVSLGIIVRSLGFSRTFGGAMIAFGLGLGIVYPLITAITYGYIDVAANVMCIQSFVCSFKTIGSTLLTLIFDSAVFGASGAGTALGSLILQTGYIAAGLTIIPLINIAIVDAFITDFSSAVGERMSFSQLFSGLI